MLPFSKWQAVLHQIKKNFITLIPIICVEIKSEPSSRTAHLTKFSLVSICTERNSKEEGFEGAPFTYSGIIDFFKFNDELPGF